ncbi:MAG TPA: serine/threonine-protein kinase [Gemmatimonadales bacterium]|nr:serine/threonine-protein kinase [Gemmatimonadales bacterium]
MTTPIAPELLALQDVLAGRYSIERELGRGGMGLVLLARDVALDRPVAIKLLPPTLAAQAEAREQFLQEARTAAGLSHPNIVPIHLVEAHGDLVFFVMGYVDGETLRERVERSGPLTPRLTMKITQEVAWALAYAHQRGVIHRDVKPDNIMIERATDRAMVTDFGIAVGMRDAGQPGGLVIGTARYMSPEQACGEPVDGRSDLYSLGATAFFALTGRAPFEAANLPAILLRQVSEPAPAVDTIRPEVPGKLAALIDRCLQKKPGDRFQSGDDLARVVGEARGREFRAPPIVRAFIRNAQVSTMVFLALALANQTVTAGKGGVSISFGGPGIIGIVLFCQLVAVARHLLREGYTFEDIRAALLAESQVQAEEADVIKQRKILRRLNSLWYRLWAGRVGRLFFRASGWGLHAAAQPALAGVEATELVLGRSALSAYRALPEATQRQLRDVPRVVTELEAAAEALRARGDTGEHLTETVAALERLRLALIKAQAGTGSTPDLTEALERARDVGALIDHRIDAEREVNDLLGVKQLRG